MPVTLYWFRFSPPARLARFAAEIVSPPGIVYEEVMLNQLEHLEKEFLKVNPAHQVPAANDDGKMMAESRDLARYFFTTYNKDSANDHWYPADPVKRKEVDEWMEWSKPLHLLVESGTIGYVVSQPGMGWREQMGCFMGLVLKNCQKASTIAAIKKQLDEAERLVGERILKTTSDLNFGDLATYEEVLMVMEIHPNFSWDNYPNLALLHALMKTVPKYDVVHAPFYAFLDKWRQLQQENKARQNSCVECCLCLKGLSKALPIHISYLLFHQKKTKKS